MNHLADLCRAAAIAGACSIGSMAFAAAPVQLEAEAPLPGAAVAAPTTIYELDTEMVVHNWVLCVSQSVAEELVQAREQSVEQAWSAYGALKEARQCGRFAELRVILQQPLYRSAAASGHDARVFGALVNLSNNWASAFVVAGGLPEE